MATNNASNESVAGFQALASGAITGRTLTGTANQISITNGAGAAGNPVFSTPQDIATTSTVTFGTLTTSSATATQIACDCTVAHGSAGPIFDLYHDSTSSNADPLAEFDYNGKSSTGTKRTFAYHQGNIIDNTNAAEKGGWKLYTMSGGTLTNQINILDTGGQYRGNNVNTASPAGFIGESITASVSSASAGTNTTATGRNVTSISVTAGVWILSGVVMYTGGVITGTLFQASINTTSATNGTKGINFIETPFACTAASDIALSIPPFSQVFSTTTTVYLVSAGLFTVGTLKSYGSLYAIRVG